MGFFEGIFDLVGEGIDCVMDGVIAVGEFAEEHPVATSMAVNVATGGMAAWSNAGTIATMLGGTGVLGNTATTGVAIRCPVLRQPMPSWPHWVAAHFQSVAAAWRWVQPLLQEQGLQLTVR